MNYIYDILVNFNNELYDFYEWNTGDNVTHIRKIPLFRVSTAQLEQIKNFNVKFSSEFLEKIENRTEKFTSRDVEKISYAALFSDTNEVIALKLNESGTNIAVSKLLIDESEDVLEVVLRGNEIALDLEQLKPKRVNNFKTRTQIEQINYLNKSLNNLVKNKEIEKLKYLYFDCFNEKQSSLETIVEKLKKAINEEQNLKIMYDFFKLISIN